MVEETLKRLPEARVYYDCARQPVLSLVSSMLMAGDEPHIHLEDDCIIDSKFRERSMEAIERFPNHIINFFPGMSNRELSEPIMLPGSKFIWLQAVYFPAGKVGEYYEWGRVNGWHSDSRDGWMNNDQSIMA